MKTINQDVISMIVSIFLGYAAIFATLLGLVFVVFTLRREHFNFSRTNDRDRFSVEIVSFHTVYLNFAAGMLISLYMSSVKVFETGFLESGTFTIDGPIRSVFILLIIINFGNAILGAFDYRYRIISWLLCATSIGGYVNIERAPEIQELTFFLIALLILCLMQVWAMVRLNLPPSSGAKEKNKSKK
ncbi:hypothetical protein [Brevibacillus centrosporus]|jgi:hypothetical protein|uniref:hypothetical protein n=1 Tax=Brevibacillus TaxID=55080 RepID=UPI0039883041